MTQVVERAHQAELSHHLDEIAPQAISTAAMVLWVKYSKVTLESYPYKAHVIERARLNTLVRKGQTRFTAFDDQILSLYARGMSTRNIASMFQGMYSAEISHTLISKVNEAMLEDVHACQCRRLDEVYPIVYLDCIVVKVNQDKRIINKAMYLALGGLNLEVKEELLGLWISEFGAHFGFA